MNRLLTIGVVVPLVVVVFLKLLNVFVISGCVCGSDARLDGKVVVVTGASSGIGRATAHDLARRGARLYLASRSAERSLPVVEEIRNASGNSDVHFKKIDLASLESIREFAREFNEEEERLDILVNNAGIFTFSDEKTTDGFQMEMGVNHLGPFLLTNLLLDLLKRSAPGSRVVNVASLGASHFRGVELDDLSADKTYEDSWLPGWLIKQIASKQANIVFSKELARRLEGTGVTTYSLHPGTVRLDEGRYFDSRLIEFMHWRPFVYLLKTRDEGSQTSICCAVDEEIGKESGLFYAGCRVSDDYHPQVDDPDFVKKFWEESERLVGLRR